MKKRRSDYDVTDSVQTTSPEAVTVEVRRIYVDLYGKAGVGQLDQPFKDFATLYRGQNPDFHGCDTSYHDIQHVLDVTLAMARLLHGYQHFARVPLDERLFRFGVILALYHDSGYIRHRNDKRHENGAEYTLTHVTRSGRLLRSYLPKLDMADLAPIAARVVHYTGFEVPIDKIKVPQPIFAVIGNLLGSADILGQMADRCYLEKCYERLFPEFVLGGIATRKNERGEKVVVFESGADLIFKTPVFFEHAARRLDGDLEAVHRYVEHHFGGKNVYLEAIQNTVNYARKLVEHADIEKLRRQPPPPGSVQSE